MHSSSHSRAPAVATGIGSNHGAAGELPPVRRAGLVHLLLTALLSASAASAQPTPDTEGKTVQLPTMTVTEAASLPEVESWSHTRISAFDVLSNGSSRETRKLLADFEKFQRAIRLVWPVPPKPAAAATLIICGRDNKFDAFRPPGTPAGEALIPSLFLRSPEQVVIVVDLQSKRISINDPMALETPTAGDFAEYEVDHYRQLYREYVHYLLSQAEVRPPAWLEEGLTQIVMDIELSDRSLIYGRIDTHRGAASGGRANQELGEGGGVIGAPAAFDWPDTTVAHTVISEQPFNVVLQHRKFIPLGQFFATTHDSPEARSPLGNTLWAKQAYAFVHFCLFGEDQRHREGLIAFVGRLGSAPLSESLFKECFKTGYAGMEKELRSYLRFTKHKYQRYEFQPADRVTSDSIELANASADQIGLIKGDALRLAGHRAAARREYDGAYLRGNRDPALLAGIGAVEANPSLARKFIDEAVKAGTNRPSAYLAQARLRLDEFVTDPGPDGKLTNTQVAAVLTPLFKARALPPPLPETYQVIAAAWKASSSAPKPEHLGVLDEGVRRFPRDSALLLATAELYLRAGAPASATSVARLGLRFTTDPAARARFEEILAGLSATDR